MSKVVKHEYLLREEYYESKSVNKGRTDKTCEYCGKTIPQGTPHDMHHFYPEFTAYAVHKKCHDNFLESLLTEEDERKRLEEEELERYHNSTEYQLEEARKIINS